LSSTDSSSAPSAPRGGDSRPSRDDARPEQDPGDPLVGSGSAEPAAAAEIADPSGRVRRASADRLNQGGDDPWEFWRSILITLAIALGIRQFLVEARYIPSGSMLPGLQLQDRLLVEKLTYRSRGPKRGEIVVFHAPHHFDPVLRTQYGEVGPLQCLLVNLPLIGSIPGLQQPACDAFIKRVIGLPGERLVVDPRGRVTIDGRPLVEPYVRNFCPVDSRGMGPCRPLNVLVPPEHVVVLGDNRANSWDGRFWPGGSFLPRREIIGRAFFRFYPFNSFGTLPDPSTPAP
jgi:signal peptidase I